MGLRWPRAHLPYGAGARQTGPSSAAWGRGPCSTMRGETRRRALGCVWLLAPRARDGSLLALVSSCGRCDALSARFTENYGSLSSAPAGILEFSLKFARWRT